MIFCEEFAYDGRQNYCANKFPYGSLKCVGGAIKTAEEFLMKKVVFIVLTCLVIAGCSTATKTFPIVYTHSPSTEFEILGTILIRSNTSVGYNTVFEEAKKQYPSTDFVIDIMIDQDEITTSYHWVAYFVRQIFGTSMRKEETRYEYTIRGTAIQYIRRNADGKIISTPTPSAEIENNPNIAELAQSVRGRQKSAPITPEIAEVYTVVSVSGNVYRWARGEWVKIEIGESLNRGTAISTSQNSSLVLSDGNIDINIPVSKQGTIERIIRGLLK
jgi:hypothetical protein